MTYYIGVFSEEDSEYTIVASFASNEHIIKAINGISSSITVTSHPKIYLEFPHNIRDEAIKFIFTKEFGNFNAYVNYYN